MSGGERHLLSIAFLPVIFLCYLYVLLDFAVPFPPLTRLFIHTMWVIPGYDFMDDDFSINFHSKRFIVWAGSTVGIIRFLYVHATVS